jgi:hypothetical protein
MRGADTCSRSWPETEGEVDDIAMAMAEKGLFSLDRIELAS